MEAAVELFNRKPSVKSLAGVGGLSAVDPDPTAVADFLRAAKGLDKTAIGGAVYKLNAVDPELETPPGFNP